MVIDIGVSNIGSLTSALNYLGATHFVADTPAGMDQATHVILPGVGAYDPAMAALAARGFVEPLRDYARGQRPVLGVCLGMQILGEGSEEGVLPGLGLVPARFIKLTPDRESRQKVPHVGFSRVYGYQDTGLFHGFGPQSFFYFTHSYALPSLDGGNIARCDHTKPFVAAFQRGNVCGAQFHPEKSQSAGLRLIANFIESFR